MDKYYAAAFGCVVGIMFTAFFCGIVLEARPSTEIAAAPVREYLSPRETYFYMIKLQGEVDTLTLTVKANVEEIDKIQRLHRHQEQRDD